MQSIQVLKSGQNNTQINYILVKREDRKRVRDAKILPYEAVAKQRRLLIADIEIDKLKGNLRKENQE